METELQSEGSITKAPPDLSEFRNFNTRFPLIFTLAIMTVAAFVSSCMFIYQLYGHPHDCFYSNAINSVICIVNTLGYLAVLTIMIMKKDDDIYFMPTKQQPVES
jgi:hypothetical protein